MSGVKSGPCCEEWSVRAELTVTPGVGLREGDSGYGSEKGCAVGSARASCSVTLAGCHTVTLTCSESPHLRQPPPLPRQAVFCPLHHDKLHHHQPPPQPSLPVYKDAAIQTSTSHIPQLFSTSPQHRAKKKTFRRSPGGIRRGRKSSGEGGGSSSDGKKPPRTVHIDVYCTGSEGSSDESSEGTPQTVFENDRVKVTHEREGEDSLPRGLQRTRRQDLSVTSLNGSSGYPSLLSTADDLTSGSCLLSAPPSTSAKDTDFSSRDSFDYDNSFDRLRIREKERIWAARMTEESSDSSSDSEEGLAWSFERSAHLKREDTIKRPPCSLRKSPSPRVDIAKSGSLSDSEATSLKYKRDSVKKPNDPVFLNLARAKKFGPIISSLKKPGHHVGPSKNPNCACDTCRYFFEHICLRNRTRSLGDRPC